MKLRVLPGLFAVCKLQVLPKAIPQEGFWALTRTDSEISLVCSEADIPADCVCVERGWRAFGVEGPLDFSLIGILSSLTGTLAEAGVALFAVSTYDTDYILIPASHFDQAQKALQNAGHTII